MLESARNVVEVASKMALVQAAVAMTSIYHGTMREYMPEYSKPQTRFWRARIVDGKTGRIVSTVHGSMETIFAANRFAREYIQIFCEDGKWRRLAHNKTSEEELRMPVLGNCEYCYGYGVFPDTNLPDGVKIPLSRAEAEEGQYADPCKSCNADNHFYYSRKNSDDSITFSSSEHRYIENLKNFVDLAKKSDIEHEW